MSALALGLAAALSVLLLAGVFATSPRKKVGVPATVRRSVGVVAEPTVDPMFPALERYRAAWMLAARGAGLSDNAKMITDLAVYGPLPLFVFWLFLAQSLQFALFASALAVGLAFLWLDQRRTKRDLVVEGQLAGFLTSFHMHVEAGQQPVNALLIAVEASPLQLQAVLAPLVEAIHANMPPSEALTRMRASTDNPILAEMCSNVRIAMRAGEGLAEQLSQLTVHLCDQSEARAEAAKELIGPKVIAVVVVTMGPMTYLAIRLGMPEWHAVWSQSIQGQVALAIAFALNAVGAMLLFQTLRKVSRGR